MRRRVISAAIVAIGLAAVASGLWWFNNVDVRVYLCPQDVPIECNSGIRVSPNPMGLWVALAGIVVLALGVRRMTWNPGVDI